MKPQRIILVPYTPPLWQRVLNSPALAVLGLIGILVVMALAGGSR
jgi:hypothetical protein